MKEEAVVNAEKFCAGMIKRVATALEDVVWLFVFILRMQTKIVPQKTTDIQTQTNLIKQCN